jgi:hypothetical protein
MSRVEYEAQRYALTPQEASEQNELLQGVDVHCMTSIETATAHRVAREIKKCAQEEVQQYVDSEEFKQMVETLKRRERERLLQDIALQIAKERCLELIMHDHSSCMSVPLSLLEPAE